MCMGIGSGQCKTQIADHGLQSADQGLNTD